MFLQKVKASLHQNKKTMRLEVSLTEVQVYLSNCYKINLNLNNKAEGIIEVEYFIPMVFSINKVEENQVTFLYKVNAIPNLLVRGAHYAFRKKLEDSPFNWDSKTKKITLDFTKVEILSCFLNFFHITKLRFNNDHIILELKEKTKTIGCIDENRL